MGSGRSKQREVTAYTHKVGLVGDVACGKTCLIDRFRKNSFRPMHVRTEKNRGGIKSYILAEMPVPVVAEVWEVQALNLFLNTVIIVIDCRNSIDQIQDTYKRWAKTCMDHGCRDIHIALNKTDLKRFSKEHHDRILEALAASEDKMVFFVSAAKNDGVDYMFKCVISHWVRGLAY